MAPNLQRLLLTLLFFPTDVRNHVANHLRPVFKCLTRTGNRLISTNIDVLNAESEKRSKCRNIALDRAVWLNCDKSALCSKSLTLLLNDSSVIRIDFRNHHRNIRSPSMSRVVRYYRSLKLCDLFFKSTDLVLLHINSTEDKINLLTDFFNIISTLNDHILHVRRHLTVDLPSSLYRLGIRFTGRTRRSNHRYTLKPRMIIQQRDKSLSYITCCANNANS